MTHLPSFAHRIHDAEEMDDFSIRDERLERALHEIRYVNRFLGGHRALRRELTPLLRHRRGRRLRVLDLGAGLGDHAVQLARWGRMEGVDIETTAVEANEATAALAASFLDAHLSASDRETVRVLVADARSLPFEPNTFDVATASLFLHHFDDGEAVQLLREMSRLAADGIVVNDLHRHVLAYSGIRVLAGVLPVSSMFRHDGPLSVRRAFRPDELRRLAEQADLSGFTIRRHWAFRLTLSTLQPGAR